MAPTQEDAGAAGTGESTQQPEPMEVEEGLSTILHTLATRGGLTTAMFFQAADRRPGEQLTFDDLEIIGQRFRERVLVTDPLLANRQKEAEEAAAGPRWPPKQITLTSTMSSSTSSTPSTPASPQTVDTWESKYPP